MNKGNSISKDNKLGIQEQTKRIHELMNQLDLSCSKMEQCAFESINTTDRVMMEMREVMVTAQNIIAQQGILCETLEMCALSLQEDEAEGLLALASDQTGSITLLEEQLHKVAHAAIEAMDAAHCIEVGVAQQSENVMQILEYSEQIIYQRE